MQFRSRYHSMHQYEGTVSNVASDAQHAFSKPLKQHIILLQDHGVEGDAHAGKFIRHRFIARLWPSQANRRQVHLIRAELFDELCELGHAVGPGDLGENVTTTGLELEHLPLGTKLYLGERAIIELTGLRTPCAQIDRFQKGLKSKMFRRGPGIPKFKCGVFGVVVVGGRVAPGDAAHVEAPPDLYCPLPAL